MLFNTLQYACFFPLVVVIYYLVPGWLRLWVLLVASYLFYASWNAVYLLLIIGLTIANYGLAAGLVRVKQRPKMSRGFLTLGIVFNLGVLVFYKYSLFLLENLIRVFGWLGFKAAPVQFSLVLPLGISFFTFEFIHYLVDLWRGNLKLDPPLKFAVFAAFFPTQIAGPIKRYEDFGPQLANLARSPDWPNIVAGLRLILFGLFKKVALADNLVIMAQTGFDSLGKEHLGQGLLPLGDAWFTILAFTFQIYFDFSGYTDMGRGSALLLGFSVPENFQRPYMAANISDFWRRWHISLSSWLRDYLYIPLGGKYKRYRSLFLTMLIGGLWHGANWTFVIWGAYHGLLLVGFWLFKTHKMSNRLGLERLWSPALKLFNWSLTFVGVVIGWVFFRAVNFDQAINLLTSMFIRHAEIKGVFLNSQRFLILLIGAGCLFLEYLLEARSSLKARLLPQSFRWADYLWPLVPLGYVGLLLLTLIAKPQTGPAFIYFQF